MIGMTVPDMLERSIEIKSAMPVQSETENASVAGSPLAKSKN
jgi:hypothetical protein